LFTYGGIILYVERTKGSKCTFIGNIIQLLWHQNSVLDLMTYHIKTQPTMMIQNIFPIGLCVYIIANPMNVEYILTNFDNYQKGHFIKHIFGEILGEGIFNIDGKHWKLQ
jgi:hypothetical protein